jgi:hypothetical protein
MLPLDEQETKQWFYGILWRNLSLIMMKDEKGEEKG